MNAIETKIEKLKRQLIGGRQDHIDEIGQWERDLKKKMLIKNISEHPAILELRKMIKDRIDASEIVLKNDRNCAGEERLRLFERKEEDKWLLSFFETAEKGIENLEKSLDYYLSDDKTE